MCFLTYAVDIWTFNAMNNETPTVRGLAADNNNKLYTETMIL